MKPVSVAFNAAVAAMARRVCPIGFDVANVDTKRQAPTSLEALSAEIAERGRFTVDGANSTDTIFGCAETNYAFRAWHDWTHWHLQAPFTVAGECAVACQQIADLAKVYGQAFANECKRYIYAEVIGQALAYDINGEFPADQVAFDHAFMAALRGSNHALRIAA